MAKATESTRALVYLVTVVTVIAGAVAQSPPSSSGCTGAVTSLSPCLSYVTSNVTTSPPPQRCCSALSSVVKTSAVCLCQLLSGTNPLGIPINQTQALSLPGACNVTSPPLSQCKAVGSPAPAPAPSSSGGGAGSGTPPTTVSVPTPAPSTSTSTPSASPPSAETQPSGVPPTSSVGGISPAGDGTKNPAVNGGARFEISGIVSVLAGVVVVCVGW